MAQTRCLLVDTIGKLMAYLWSITSTSAGTVDNESEILHKNLRTLLLYSET